MGLGRGHTHTHPCSRRCPRGHGSGLPQGSSQPDPGPRSGCGLSEESSVSRSLGRLCGPLWAGPHTCLVPLGKAHGLLSFCLSARRGIIITPRGDRRPLGESRHQSTWVSHYFSGRKHKLGKDGWTWLDNGQLPHKMPSWVFGKAEITKCNTPRPDSGIASWGNWEIFLKFYDLPKRKNYKAVWEVTPCPVLLILGETE